LIAFRGRCRRRRLVSLPHHAVVGRRRVKVGVALFSNNRGSGGSGVGATALSRVTRAVKKMNNNN
jgi:hypothetical protein